MRRTKRKANRSNGDKTSSSLNREVFGLRMVDNNSRSRLLWLQLELFSECNVDAPRVQECEQLFLILESWARGITKAVTSALVLLPEQPRQIRRICACDTELFANAPVPQLSHRFSALDAQSVKVKIVRVIV